MAYQVALSIGSSMFHPSTAGMIATYAGRRFGLSMSLFNMGGTFAFGVGPLCIAWLVSRWGLEVTPWTASPGLAVMVLLFALSWGRRATPKTTSERALNKKEIEATIAHFETALKVLGYKKGGADLLPRILQTLRGLIKRAGLLEPEAQMIKGLSRKIRDKVGAPR